MREGQPVRGSRERKQTSASTTMSRDGGKQRQNTWSRSAHTVLSSSPQVFTLMSPTAQTVDATTEQVTKPAAAAAPAPGPPKRKRKPTTPLYRVPTPDLDAFRARRPYQRDGLILKEWQKEIAAGPDHRMCVLMRSIAA